MRILISGGGIAGLAFAGFLRQRGLDPQIVDKAGQWGRAGYGIALWGNGIRILEQLGLKEAFYEAGERIDQWTLRDGNGEILSEARLEFPDQPPLVAIHRADLHACLLREVPESWIRLDTSVVALSHTGDVVEVMFSDGSREAFDMVVGADGVRSGIRELVMAGSRLEDTGTAVWSFWIPEGLDIPSGFNECWYGDGKAFLVAPVAGKHMGSVGLPLDEEYAAEDHLDYLKQRVISDEWLLPEVTARLTDADAVYHDRNFQVAAPEWSRERTVLIGDAAHAIHPIAGMGASLAMEDAYVLADELTATRVDDVPAALDRYEDRRKSRVETIQRHARLSKTVTFTRSSTIQSLRNLLVGRTRLFERFFVGQARKVSEDLFEKL